MEKYAVDMSELPVTDDQIRDLKKLCKEAGLDFKMPNYRQDADDMIEKLAAEGE
jgi:diphthamide synthase (EF-2-diphthine--ammonia ligase)